MDETMLKTPSTEMKPSCFNIYCYHIGLNYYEHTHHHLVIYNSHYFTFIVLLPSVEFVLLGQMVSQVMR